VKLIRHDAFKGADAVFSSYVQRFNLSLKQSRVAMEQVWTDTAKPYLDPPTSLCPAHESIHVNVCRSKSKPDVYTLYTSA
jgi:hypothetical protein